MTKDTYLKVTGFLRTNEKRIRLVRLINRLFTSFVFFIYPLYLFSLFLEKDSFLWRAILVPAVSFVAVSAYRYLRNEPRPYEKFEVPPVLPKDTKGKSFPSRHVFSVFIIAATIFCQHPGAGVMLGVLGLGIALIRVFGGVHEPRDVIAGAAVGIACGFIGYYLLPMI